MKLDPVFRFWTLGLQTAWLTAEAQTVIALRLAGFHGLWPMGPHEATRMVAEKWPAFIQSAGAAGAAALAGHSPDRIAAEALAPIRRKTRANSRRLTRGTRQRRRTG